MPTVNLMQEGMHVMLKQICSELQGTPEEQLRALRTLANMSSSNSAVPVTTVQDGFRKLGAFAPLVKLMHETLPERPDPPKLVPAVPSDDPSDQSAASALMQRRSTFNASLECCKELVTRCPENAKEAVKHGVVSIVTTYIATHLNPPPNPAALRLLYQLVVCKEHAEEIYETMTSCLTIPALARLLDAALVHAGPQDRGSWAAEILEVLAPLVINSQEAAEQLVTLGGMHALSHLVMHPTGDPLPLSLMLDMMEALVAMGDDSVQAEVRQMLVRDGLLQPLLQALKIPGLNRKSVTILSSMAKEESTVQVMHAIISPRTLHELCRVALDALEASDLEAGSTAELLNILLIPGSLLSLRNLILGRCVHIALTLPRVAPQVVAMATTVSGQAVLDNLAAENALDCALAAAHLFTACSDASLLTKQHRLAVLCAATLREARDGCTGPEALAAAAVTSAVKHLHMIRESADAVGGGSGAATGVLPSMVSLASAEGSVTSLTADILQRVSSSTELHDTTHSIHSIGQRTPISPNTPVSSSAAAGTLPHAVVSSLPSSPPLFHHWQSVDELRAQSAADLKFQDSQALSGGGESGHSAAGNDAFASGRGGRANGVSRAGRGSLELSGSGGAQQRRGNGATIDSINTVATATSGGASGSVGRSSKRRTMTKNSSQSRMANMAGGKLTPLHEELHMCALDDGVRDGGPGEAIGGVGGGARSPGTHRHPTPPISKTDVNKKRYDTVTFSIGKREFYALGWVLEQCCPRLRHMLEGMESVSAPIELPPIAGLQAEDLYTAFSRLVEFSYTGSTDLTGTACGNVWVLAASFGYEALKERCETILKQSPQLWSLESGRLKSLVVWAATHDPDGPLLIAATAQLVDRLHDAVASGALADIAKHEQCSGVVVAGMYINLQSMLKVAMESGVLANAAGVSMFPAGL